MHSVEVVRLTFYGCTIDLSSPTCRSWFRGRNNPSPSRHWLRIRKVAPSHRLGQQWRGLKPQPPQDLHGDGSQASPAETPPAAAARVRGAPEPGFGVRRPGDLRQEKTVFMSAASRDISISGKTK